MSDRYLPFEDSPEAVQLRSNFSHIAVEKSLQMLLSGYAAGNFPVWAGRLPEESDGLAIRLIQHPERPDDAAAQWRCEAEFSGRSLEGAKLSEIMAKIVQRLPEANVIDSSIPYTLLEQTAPLEFKDVRHQGLLKTVGSVRLRLILDRNTIVFPAANLNEERDKIAAAQLQWQAITASSVQNAIKKLLDSNAIFPSDLPVFFGTMPEFSDAVSVCIVGEAPKTSFDFREYELLIQARSTPNELFVNSFGKLGALLPLIDCKPTQSNITFVCIQQSAPIQKKPVKIFGREKLFGSMQCTLRVNPAQSQSSGSDNGVPDVPRADPAPLVDLERALTEFIAKTLSLSVDKEICRGNFPNSPQFSKLKAVVHFDSLQQLEQSSNWQFQFELLVRSPSRDEAMNLYSLLDSRFPCHDQTLSSRSWSATALALWKTKGTFTVMQQHGQDYWLGSLIIQILF